MANVNEKKVLDVLYIFVVSQSPCARRNGITPGGGNNAYGHGGQQLVSFWNIDFLHCTGSRYYYVYIRPETFTINIRLPCSAQGQLWLTSRLAHTHIQVIHTNYTIYRRWKVCRTAGRRRRLSVIRLQGFRLSSVQRPWCHLEGQLKLCESNIATYLIDTVVY